MNGLNKDDIIRMALEAGFEEYHWTSLSGESELDRTLQIGEYPVGESVFKFAALVAAAEREARAKVAESYEPVAWINAEEIGYMHVAKLNGSTDWKTNLGLVPEENDIPLYTAPPKKEWVGLTDEEKRSIFDSCEREDRGYVAAMVEAKLKDKNAA